MKSQRISPPVPAALRRWSGKILAGLLLLGATQSLHAEADLVMSIFETEESAAAWTRWWGNAPQTYEFDGTVNAGPDTTSGSLKATIDFDLTAYGGENQFALQGDLSETINGANYTNVVMDIRWDPASPKNPDGNFGYLEYGLKTADFSQIWLGGMTIPGDASGWIHIAAPIDPSAAKVDQVKGVVLKMWSGDPVTGLTGSTVFWLDNVIFHGNTNTAPPSPPTMALSPAVPGLQLFASAAGAQYQRQNIRTVGADYSWVGRPAPVTYSVTLKSYPDAAHSGFQTHMFLVPAASPPTETAPDWNQPNVVFLEIGNNADGGAYASLRYKTNSPNGNTMYYNANPVNGPVGSLGGVGSATVLGTWSLTFKSATDITLTAPDGTSSDLTIPAESAALFADPLYAFFGIQPNQLNNLGQSVVFGQVQITGTVTPLNDNFAGVPPEEGGSNQLDPAVWQVVAEDPAGIYLVPQDSAYWAWWTLPAAGFVPQQSTSLTNASWADLTQPVAQIGTRKGVLLPAPSLPAGGSVFYRVANPN